MMWVIRRTDQGGGYVAVPGSAWSYTMDLGRMRTFNSEAAARAECCPGNEVPVHINHLLQRPER